MAHKEFIIKKGAVIYSQGLDSVVLDVQGTQGQLFSITDNLIGLLYSVNDISGIPIMEVYSDDRVLMGTYGARALEVNGSNVLLPNTQAAIVDTDKFLVLDGNIIKTRTGAQILSDIDALGATATAVNSTQYNGIVQPTYTSSLRANVNISGGGTITFDGSGNLLWSARFIVISNGRGSTFSTNGYFDINCPTSGTITGVGGATNKTATAAGIPLAIWEALYYILPIGSGNVSVAANFRVVSYTTDLEVPHNWLLLAVRNGDTNMLYLPHSGNRLALGTSIITGTYDARRTVISDTLTTSRNINGTAFNGSADITTANWGTARTITIGSTGKSVNGSANVSWSLAEIGAEAAFTTLGVSKGGTGASTLTGVLIGNGTSALTAVVGTASQVLRRNSGNTAYEFFTQTLGTISGVVLTSPINGQLLQFNGTNWVNATIISGGSGITWNEINTNTNASFDNGYIANSSTKIEITLPSNPSLNKPIKILGRGSGGWRVNIPVGSTLFVLGLSVTGWIESTSINDAVEIISTTDGNYLIFTINGNIDYNI
jgi:hypothetical protein